MKSIWAQILSLGAACSALYTGVLHPKNGHTSARRDWNNVTKKIKEERWENNCSMQ